nr:hypothetical protein [uncultured organism]
MHIEKVRFDEVFDVAARAGNFSFRSQGRPRFGAKLKNHFIPAVGSTFAIAFAQPGDWASVLGWRDLASDDVVLARPTWAVWLLALGDATLHGAPLLVAGLVFGGLAGGLAAAAAFAGVALYRTRRNRAVKRALLGAVAADPQA